MLGHAERSIKMNKAIGTIAVWAGPTLGAWVTGEPLVCFAFVLSFFATICIWGMD
jgi:hypothetical protein